MRRLLAQSAINAAAQLLPQAVAIVSTPLVVLHLSSATFGVWALLTGAFSVLLTLNGGVGAAVMRFVAVSAGRSDQLESRRLLLAGVLIGLATSAALGCIAWPFAHPLSHVVHVSGSDRAELVTLIRALPALVGLALVGGAANATLAACDRFGRTLLCAIAGQVAYLSVLLACFLAHPSLNWLLVAMLGELGASAGLALIFASFELRLSPVALAKTLRSLRGAAAAGWGDFISYTARAQAFSITELVSLEADVLIVAAVLPVAQVGYFSVASQLAAAIRSLPVFVLGPLGVALARLLGRYGREETMRASRLLNAAWIAVCTGYTAVATVIIAPALTVWLHGRGGHLTPALGVIIMAGFGFKLLSGVLSSYIRAIGAVGFELRYGLLAAGLNLVLTLPGALVFGVYGVAAATAVSSVVGTWYFFRITQSLAPGLALLPSDFLALCVVPVLPVVGGSMLLIMTGVRGPLGLLSMGAPAALGLAIVALLSRRRFSAVRDVWQAWA